MLNPFQLGYSERLREWKNLRLLIRGQSLDQVAIHVDQWWQQAPLIKHHLHPQDFENWPDPWTILSENIYCPLTRAIGMCYTLLLSDITTVSLVQAVDQECADHNLVIVGNAKYVLNYYPYSVLSTSLADFSQVKVISITKLKDFIQ
jgi:hypothetical protein